MFIDQEKQEAFVNVQVRLCDATLLPIDGFISHPEVVKSTLETCIPALIQANLH